MDLQKEIVRWDCYACTLDDETLLRGIKRLCVLERRVQYKFLCYLYAIHDKKVYAKQGYASLFSFMVGYLGYSESSALKRSQIVLKAAQFPPLYAAIKHRKLSMSAAQKLCPYLNRENGFELIEECAGKSVREVEKVIIARFPQAGAEDRVRQRVAPLSVDEVSVQFTASTGWAKKLEKLQALLSHKHPKGRIADITEEAFDMLIQKLEGKRSGHITRVMLESAELEQFEKEFGSKVECDEDIERAETEFLHRLSEKDGNITRLRSESPEGATALDSRYIPKEVELAVWQRDSARCTFVSHTGKRCEARRFLQIDHIKPWALGGSSHDIDNLQLLCSTHNKLRAQETYDLSWLDRMQRCARP